MGRKRKREKKGQKVKQGKGLKPKNSNVNNFLNLGMNLTSKQMGNDIFHLFQYHSFSNFPSNLYSIVPSFKDIVKILRPVTTGSVSKFGW